MAPVEGVEVEGIGQLLEPKFNGELYINNNYIM